jgi:hypothetical protein
METESPHCNLIAGERIASPTMTGTASPAGSFEIKCIYMYLGRELLLEVTNAEYMNFPPAPYSIFRRCCAKIYVYAYICTHTKIAGWRKG